MYYMNRTQLWNIMDIKHEKTNHGCRIGDADGMMARFEDPATQCEIHDTKGYGAWLSPGCCW